MARKADRKALGRGLSALLGDTPGDVSVNEGAPSATNTLAIDLIRANPDQPRRMFDDKDLEDLANSIREHGVLQPIIVRPDPKDATRYQIVAGERRWRAAQRASVHEVPVIIKKLSDTEVLELALIENIQRVDLDPVEEARGYSQLIDAFGHTQEKLSKIIGKSRSHVANMMRLLALPDVVLDLLQRGALSAGHARALINAPDPTGLARKVVSEGLSVRQTEVLARKVPVEDAGRRQPAAPSKDADTRALEGDLSSTLGMKVSIEHKAGNGGGQIRISYKSLDDLDALCERLSK